MKRLAALLIALPVALFSAPAVAQPAPPRIAVALTEDFIRVDTGFSGVRLILFGAVAGVENPAGSVDLIATIRGPEKRFQIRRLERRQLIWMPGDAHYVDNAPSLYLTSATRPIGDIAPLPDQARFALGYDFLNITAPTTQHASPQGEEADGHNNHFVEAFEDNQDEIGLYRNNVGGVTFKKDALFTVSVDLPANTPVGAYDVEIFLYRDGELLGRDEASLTVNKVGLERQIYELAHGRPIFYGIICVAMSLLAGWLAGLAFRK